MASWTPAERVQKNAAGEYRALIGGEWIPVEKAQKNESGQFRVMPKESKKEIIQSFNPSTMKATYGEEMPVSELGGGEQFSQGLGSRLMQVGGSIRELLPEWMRGKELPTSPEEQQRISEIKSTTPGMVGGAATDIALSAAPVSKTVQIAKALAPARTVIAPLAGGAVGSAGYYGATTPGSSEDRAKAAGEAALWSAGGELAVKGAGAGLPWAGRQLRDSFDIISGGKSYLPWSESSVERMAKKGLGKVAEQAGGKRDIITAALRAKEVVPGSKPTMKEAIAQENLRLAEQGKPQQLGAELVSLQDELAGIPGISGKYGTRAQEQEAAINKLSKSADESNALQMAEQEAKYAGQADKFAKREAYKQELAKSLAAKKERAGLVAPAANLEKLGETAKTLRRELKGSADEKSKTMLAETSKIAGNRKFDVSPVLAKADELKSSMKFDKDYVPSLFGKLDELRAKQKTSVILDLAGKPIKTGAQKPSADFDTLRELRQSAAADLRLVSGSADTASRQNARMLNSFIDEIDNVITAGGGNDDVAKSYGEFRDYYKKEYAPAFLQGTNIKQSLKDVTGAPKIKPEDVFANYLQAGSPTEMRQYIALYGKTKEGGKMMSDAVLDRYKKEVVFGGITPKKHDKFMEKYAAPLSVLKENGIDVGGKIAGIGTGVSRSEKMLSALKRDKTPKLETVKEIESSKSALEARDKIAKELAVSKEAERLGSKITKSQEGEVTKQSLHQLPPTLSTEGMITRFILSKSAKGSDKKVANLISDVLLDPKKTAAMLKEIRREELSNAIRGRRLDKASRAAGITSAAIGNN